MEEEIRLAIEKTISGESLEEDEAKRVALGILSEDINDILISALLVSLKAKGESPEEIEGFASAMLEVRVPVDVEIDRLVDTCGTGGDKKRTFNISTAAGIIAAACGVPIAKHGNRSVSSGCGSADVLEELGVNINLGPLEVADCIRNVGIGFMFAPAFHPAMRRVMQVRKSLGFPTIFNILGPLSNPARVRRQVLGVNKREMGSVIAEALRGLGCVRAFILHGLDGMDEFTLCDKTIVCEIGPSGVSEYELSPESMGLKRRDPSELTGGNAKENARIICEILGGKEGAPLEAAVANAAFALLAGGVTKTLEEGIERAKLAVESGKASIVLQNLIEFSRSCSSHVS
ncbi:MAG: anthranilate phosphoribosyltransferase [Actinomycetota bacterium]|nr:anthranilate phosphoribosyltransferase [Actinomycetota bacterium]